MRRVSDSRLDHRSAGPEQPGRRRAHSAREIAADTFVHGIGLITGLAGSSILLACAVLRDDAQRLAAVIVYAAGLMGMLTASAAYNIGYATRFRDLLRRFDHAAIFVMIAGTYTPLTTALLRDLLAVVTTAAIWATSVSGILVRLITPRMFERIGVVFYLALGWAAALIVAPFTAALPASSAAMLAAGGALYTVGVVFHLWEKLPFQNAIWHGFVLAGAICHYVAILTGVVLAPG